MNAGPQVIPSSTILTFAFALPTRKFATNAAINMLSIIFALMRKKGKRDNAVYPNDVVFLFRRLASIDMTFGVK